MVVVMLVALWLLFKPLSRLVISTVLLTQQRVVLAMIGLATLGISTTPTGCPG